MIKSAVFPGSIVPNAFSWPRYSAALRDRGIDPDLPKQIDGLRPAIFDDLKLLSGQVGDWLAAAVGDDDVDANNVDSGSERGAGGAL